MVYTKEDKVSMEEDKVSREEDKVSREEDKVEVKHHEHKKKDTKEEAITKLRILISKYPDNTILPVFLEEMQNIDDTTNFIGNYQKQLRKHHSDVYIPWTLMDKQEWHVVTND
jgi:hypothetical protein